MCFSANASFSVGVVLTATGILALNKTKKNKIIPFAIIPIIFGVQQITEGFIWLSLTKTGWENWHIPSTYIYLVFAQVVWPFWVPFSILLMEPKGTRKTILMFITGLGTFVAGYLLYCLFTYPIESYISSSHISYELHFRSHIIWHSGIFYFIPTVIPSFISGIKKMTLLGVVLLSTFIISKIFYSEHVISVWCFFAAAISIIVYFIVNNIPAGTIKESATEPVLKEI